MLGASQELKLTIPRFFHTYYDQLPHITEARKQSKKRSKGEMHQKITASRRTRDTFRKLRLYLLGPLQKTSGEAARKVVKAGRSKEAQDVIEATDAATLNCKKKSTGGRAKHANRSVDCAVKTAVNCKNSKHTNKREVVVV